MPGHFQPLDALHADAQHQDVPAGFGEHCGAVHERRICGGVGVLQIEDALAQDASRFARWPVSINIVRTDMPILRGSPVSTPLPSLRNANFARAAWYAISSRLPNVWPNRSNTRIASRMSISFRNADADIVASCWR